MGKIIDSTTLISPQNKAGNPADPTPFLELHNACSYTKGVQHFPDLLDPKTLLKNKYPILSLYEFDALYNMIFFKVALQIDNGAIDPGSPRKE